MYMDKAMTNAERLAYARCFIEVSAKKPLPSSVILQVEGREEFEVEVEYEWLPPMCTKCSSFGRHMYSHCPTKSTWVPTSIKLTGEGNDSKANEGKGEF